MSKFTMLGDLFLLLSAALANTAFGDAESLQAQFDAAARSPDKILKLSGDHFVEKPVVLDNRHSGLVVDGGGSARIISGRKISNWVDCGKYWSAKFDSAQIPALFVNGVRAELACDGEYRYVYSEFPSDNYNAVVLRNQDIKQLEGLSPSQLGDVVMDAYLVWTNSRCRIVKIEKNADGKTSAVYIKNHLTYPLLYRDKNARFRLLNTNAAFTKKGQFRYDSSEKTVYYIPRDGEKIGGVSAYIPVSDCALSAGGTSADKPVCGLAFRGVRFEYGAVSEPSGRAFSQAEASIGGFVKLANAKNVAFENCVFAHIQSYALEIASGVDGAKVENCEFFDLGCGGVRVGKPLSPQQRKNEPQTRAVSIKNNIIYKYGRYGKSAVGVLLFDCGDCEISHNTIFDGYYSGISVGWTWGFAPTRTQNNIIADNKIFNIGYGLLCDMGGIYTLGEASGSRISGNEIFGVCRHRYGGWGIYNDEGSANFVIENNYVHDNDEDGYHMHYGKNCIVRNNVFVDGGASQIALGRRGEEYPDAFVFTGNIVSYKSPSALFRNDKNPISRINAKFSKNLYWNKSGAVDFGRGSSLAERQKKLGQDEGSIVADPELDCEVPHGADFGKIGFVPFSVKGAGVVGAMKARLEKVLDGYTFPPVLRIPVEPPFPREYSENLNYMKVGGKLACGKITSAKNGNDIRVLAENGVKFLRFTDSFQKSKKFCPYWTYPVSGGGFTAATVSFEFRLNKTSTFIVECRGDTGFPSPMVRFQNGALMLEGKGVELPQNVWLKAELNLKLGSDKSYSVKISDGDKTLVSRTVPKYDAAAMSMFRELVVQQNSNADGDSFDIRNLNFNIDRQSRKKSNE